MPTPALIQNLQRATLYDHPVTSFEVIETHISWVILTGEYAYKIKKPINLGFLDFTTLEQRHHYCQQELALNRRLAPQLYLDLVSIGGSPQQPVLNGDHPAIEYAIKMRQFSQNMLLDRLLEKNKLQPSHIDQLADTIATFHQTIEIAPADSDYGTPTAVYAPIDENFRQIRSVLTNEGEKDQLLRLETWSRHIFEQLCPVITERKKNGFIRNCHGDMHLGNITLMADEIIIFDCIEFNDNFRWIDTISEIAFTTMDLIDRGQSHYAARLLDRYLQRTGDYAGVTLLRFYQVYRALVRAKVAAIRAHQPGIDHVSKQTALHQHKTYTQLAEQFTQQHNPTLYIAHGLSGSGKTSLTQPLLEHYGMIRLRSDVERKRLFGMTAESRTNTSTQPGVYSSDTTQRVYQQLLATTRQLCMNGYDAIIDATFLKQSQRQLFRALAHEMGVPFKILHFHADVALLREWIKERAIAGKDASEATIEVLEQQLATEEPLLTDEADQIISIDTGNHDAAEQLLQLIKPAIEHQP